MNGFDFPCFCSSMTLIIPCFPQNLLHFKKIISTERLVLMGWCLQKRYSYKNGFFMSTLKYLPIKGSMKLADYKRCSQP